MLILRISGMTFGGIIIRGNCGMHAPTTIEYAFREAAKKNTTIPISIGIAAPLRYKRLH